MSVAVTAHTDAAEVLDAAGTYLAGEPTRSAQVHRIVRYRTERPQPGRYWLARDGSEIVGVALHSPAHMHVVLGPMAPDTAVAVAERVVADRSQAVPGVRGEVAATASFAGRWTELRGTAAVPEEGQRLYELGALEPPPSPPGGLRPAREADRPLLVDWTAAFVDEAATAFAETPTERVDAYLSGADRDAGLWVWDDGEPRSMAALNPAVGGVVGVGLVYTPKELRRQGYAGAVVAGVSAQVLESGRRAALYTQLANPVSNSLYRRMGYRAVAEILEYRFT
jgi:GNAT superfamily N-acetyltransferase